MIPLLIGTSSGLLIIIIIALFKKLDKRIIYALILSGIGFLYVGFVWMDRSALIQTSVQAIFFLFLAYYGVRNLFILAFGYFLHGCWDLAYSFIDEPGLVPPKYDLFCSSLDFIIGAYILLFRKHFNTLLHKTP